MNRLAACLSCAFACCLPAAGIADDAAPADVAAAGTPSVMSGVVIRVAAAPVTIGTQITIDGLPVGKFWDGYFADLFALLDRNDDGLLDRTEAARVPRPASLLAEFRGDFDNATADFVPPADIDRSPADGSVSRAEFAQHLRSAGVGSGELRVAPASAGLDAASARRLFDLLASPPDAWESSSLDDAYARLRRFDANDDQRLSFAELQVRAPAHSPQANSNARQKQPPLFKARTEGDPESGTIVNVAIPLADARLAGDGADVKVLSTRELNAVRLTLYAARGYGEQDFDSARQSLLQQFETDDADKSHSLDRREVERSASSGHFAMLMAIADRDADGRLTLREMNRYLDLQASAAKHWVVVTARDCGSSLAAALDADGDSSLSLRELRHGWPRVIGWDRNGDRKLAWDEVPHECQLTWSVGRPHPEKASAGSPAKAVASPDWFLRMDQNGDGDLSRREFLGTLDDFRRCDADGDGLISPSEANAARKR